MPASATKIKYVTTFSNASTATAEVVSTDPDGVLYGFSGTLIHAYSRPNHVAFSATVATATVAITESGAGILTGTNVTGTINYLTGDWTLLFTVAPPDAASSITCTYDYVNYVQTPIGAEVLFTPTSATKYFALLAHANVVPTTFTVTVSFNGVLVTFIDDGNGNIVNNTTQSEGNNLIVGAIEYATGRIVLYFFIPPESVAVLSNYTYRQGTSNSFLLRTKDESYNFCLITPSGIGATTYFSFVTTEDGKNFSQLGYVVIPSGGYESIALPQNKDVYVVTSNIASGHVDFELQR